MSILKSAFLPGSFLPEFNNTLITLIPKQENPENISHFRPIALCNIAIKGITKVIANRLKQSCLNWSMSNKAVLHQGGKTLIMW